MQPSRLRIAAIGLLIAVSLAACSGGGSSSTPIAHPGGDALVFRIETTGGFIAPEARFTAVPEFTLLGDGRVIEPGAVDMIYPGPAILPLLERRLSETGIQAVLREVAATGLFTGDRDLNGAQARVMDAGTTVFTFHAGGREARVAVYGLGMVDEGAASGLSADELAAHRLLTALASRLAGLDGWLNAAAWSDPTSRPFRADALRLLVRNADADPPDQSGIARQMLPWPVATDPASFGSPVAGQPGARCGVVTGLDAAGWLAALDRANAITRFVAAGHAYAVTARPLLPDEPRSCPTGS